ALAGALAADRASRTRLRLGSVVVLAVAVAGIGGWAARLAVQSSLVAGALGPVAAIWVSEALLWLLLMAPSVFALRFASARRPVMAVAEVLAVGLAVVRSLAAHRGGMVHRPHEIGDWAWSRGIDPVVVLLVLGGLGTLLLAALLVREERRRRLPLHFSVLAVVALILVLIIRFGGLPKPEPAADLGLTGDPEAGDESSGGQGSADGDPADQLGDLEFRDEYGSNGSQAPVAVVVLHDDYSPPSGVYYFRQSAFSQFNGRRLVQATRDDVDRDVVKRFPGTIYEVPGAPPLSEQRMALRTTMGLLIDHVRPFALDSPAAIRPIPNPSPMRFQRAFEALSHVRTLPYRDMIGRRPGEGHWSEEQWEHYTEAPRDPRYAALAVEVMSLLRDEYRNDPLAEALAIKTYLDENGIYSRKSRHAGVADPAGSFLFGDLTGYCVHFAHAATYLLRTRGIPARVAAGYGVAESSRAGGSAVMIRGADAHAWPEIYLENIGWVVVDPAPQRSLDEPAAPPDQALQRMLGEMMRRQFGEEPSFEDQLRRQVNWSRLGRLLLGAVLIFVAVAYLVKLYRFLVPHLARPRQLYRLGYRAALDRLAGLGWRRRFGESREDFARRAENLSPSFAQLTEHHLRWALGSRRLADSDGLHRLLTEVGREIRGRVPIARRLLGAINPFTWMMAR
ncbi:MAG: transglutaminase domain-containing protein, partial [bacterium]|nr:transglutaminase domain-containing protein [bacterium]